MGGLALVGVGLTVSGLLERRRERIQTEKARFNFAVQREAIQLTEDDKTIHGVWGATMDAEQTRHDSIASQGTNAEL